MEYLSSIERQMEESSHRYSESTRSALVAYSLYVQAKFGVEVTQPAIDAYKRYEHNLSLESCGWMLVALNSSKNKSDTAAFITQIRQRLLSNVTETAETAHFVTSYGDDGKSVLLHSDFRTDAVLVDALLHIDGKNNALVVKLVKGLQAQKTAGRWRSTQENCFVLIALDHYFKVYEATTPNFTAHVWFADEYAATHAYKGRSTDTNTVNIPMQLLINASSSSSSSSTAPTPTATQPTNILLHKDGPGRLYYRFALNYAPSDFAIKAANYGFKVERSYAAVKVTTTNKPASSSSSSSSPSAAAPSSDDVSFDAASGEWKLKLGSKIKVTVSMTVTARRYHIALVDYIPAGCEIMNTGLKGSLAELPELEGDSESGEGVTPFWQRRGGSTKYWKQHENFRDERAEAFSSLLWPGTYEFTYTMRATAAGVFRVPPAKAEEMYSPEVFGRSSSLTVRIS